MDTQKYARRRTREAWQELVQQWETTQMSAKAWCLQHENLLRIFHNLAKTAKKCSPGCCRFFEHCLCRAYRSLHGSIRNRNSCPESTLVFVH